MKQIWQNRLQNMKKEQEISLDKWQEEVLEHKGSTTIRAGRQVGKSFIIGLKATDFVITNKNVVVLVVAASQRQASLLFEKIRGELDIVNDGYLNEQKKEHSAEYNAIKSEVKRRQWEFQHGIYKDFPTKTKIALRLNNSILYCLPAGKSGHFIRGYTIDLLIADEAAYIPEAVWVAVKPMLAVSRKRSGFGWEILLGTPFGKGGYFYNSFNDADYKQFHVSSERCDRIPKDWLRKERSKLSKMEYAQEYLGEFIDEFNQLFSTKLIKERMTFMSWEIDKDYNTRNKYYLGMDIARYGADENAFVISELGDNGIVKIVKVITSERKSITDTVGRALILHDKYNFRKIFTDDTGIGGGVTDLLKEKLGKNLVYGMNNAKVENKKSTKEDLYSNAVVLLEGAKCDMLNSMKLQRSLKSITFTYSTDKRLKIYGKYDHIAEAFVRACWCVKAKGLKLFAY